MAATLLARVNRDPHGWYWKVDIHGESDEMIDDLFVIDRLYRQAYGRTPQFLTTCNEEDGLTLEFFINPRDGEPSEAEFLRALMKSNEASDGPCLDFAVKEGLVWPNK